MSQLIQAQTQLIQVILSEDVISLEDSSNKQAIRSLIDLPFAARDDSNKQDEKQFDFTGLTPLCLACMHCSSDAIVKLLVETHGAKMSQKCVLGDLGEALPIHFACANANTSDVLRYLLSLDLTEYKISVDLPSSNPQKRATCLHVACMNPGESSVQIVDLLLQSGADWNQRYSTRRAIHLAAMNGIIKEENNKGDTQSTVSIEEKRIKSKKMADIAFAKIQLLVNKGEDINVLEGNNTGATPLFLASGNLVLFERILAQFSKQLNLQKKFKKHRLEQSPQSIMVHFMEMAQELDPLDEQHAFHILNLLVLNGADYSESCEGVRLIHQACSANQLFLIRSLIEKGEDINVRTTNEGYTCCFILSRNENNVQRSSAILKYIIKKYRADMNIPSNKGVYPITDLVTVDRADDLEFAIVHGAANINVTTGKDLNLLHLAVFKGCIKSLKVLLAHGLDPNIPDKQGQLPIHLLSASHLPTADPSGEMLKLLIDAGAKIDIPRKTLDRFDYLIHMIQPHYIPTLVSSVGKSNNFDIDVLNSDGMTALHVAAASLNGPKVRALVKAGANAKLLVNSRNNEQTHNKTAYQLAEMQDAPTIGHKYIKFHICKILTTDDNSSKTPSMELDEWLHEMDNASTSQQQELLFSKLSI